MSDAETLRKLLDLNGTTTGLMARTGRMLRKLKGQRRDIQTQLKMGARGDYRKALVAELSDVRSSLDLIGPK